MSRMKWLEYQIKLSVFVCFLASTSAAYAQGDGRFTGIWTLDEGFQITELLFRSDGRYRLDTRSTDPDLDFSSTDSGRYQVQGQTLTILSYDYFGEPQGTAYEFELFNSSLTLHRTEFDLTYVYQFKPGSREDVLAREQAAHDLVGTWGRTITFAGQREYTFRPGGYYFLKRSSEGDQFPPEYIRGRYEQQGSALKITPYSGTTAPYEIDFFGNTLTIIRTEEFSGSGEVYEKVPGSSEEVRAKAAEAEAFLNRSNWLVGVWKIKDGVNEVALTFRPDGHYASTNSTEILRGLVRGRYTLDTHTLHLFPFIGQGLYSRDNGDFGQVDRTREIDYYDGELQLINLEALSQSVALARKVGGSEEVVLEQARLAQAERAQPGWHIGIWQVNDPNGWMEFTFRPDGRYIAKSGTAGVPGAVERGTYTLKPDKLSLAPYSGLGEARGFELDLYQGDLFLVGDSQRMVVARKVPLSDSEVIEKTVNPEALKGERGSILGLWTANLPGQSSELVFRDDGQFRLTRCANDVISEDYGLYSADMTTRSLVYDSRFIQVQSQGLDFYGNTMTIYGGVLRPSTYTVNPGSVDTAIAASLAADAAAAQVDAQWLARVPVGPRDPNAVQIPTGVIPADPRPGVVFPDATVFTHFQLYRRLIPGFVYFNELGTIKSVAVVNTSEWHFFPTGRVLVRFQNYRAGLFYPNTIADISDSWGAYAIGPKPVQQDILHIYADNELFIQTDLGEESEMTLEDGRRNLFWGKDYQILSEWAAERKSIPCQAAANADPSLMNTGIALSTQIKPDLGESATVPVRISGPVSGKLLISGTSESAATLVTERATAIVPPVVWQQVQTNDVPAGPFSFLVPQGTDASAFFRVRQK